MLKTNDNYLLDQKITPKENEVISLLCRGLSRLEIAEIMGTSPNTTRNHVANIMAKLGAISSPEIVIFTIEAKLQEKYGTNINELLS
jgi:DNA-binding CsgD family transcriptional regulator